MPAAPLVAVDAPSASRSRAALNLPGACPICGGSAPRKVTISAGLSREVFRCPVDGEIGYVAGAQAALELPGFTSDPVEPPVPAAAPTLPYVTVGGQHTVIEFA